MRSPAPAYVNVVMREDVCEYALHVSQRFAFLFLPDSPIVRASKIQIVRSSIPVCWCGAVALQLCRMEGKTARKVRCRLSRMHIVCDSPNSEACCIGKTVWKGVQIDFTLWSRMRCVDRCLLRLSAMASSIKWDSAKQGLCMFCWPCNQQGHVFDGVFRVMWMGTAQKLRGRRAWQYLAWQWVADQWRCGRAPWFARNGTWVLISYVGSCVRLRSSGLCYFSHLFFGGGSPAMTQILWSIYIAASFLLAPVGAQVKGNLWHYSRCMLHFACLQVIKFHRMIWFMTLLKHDLNA